MMIQANQQQMQPGMNQMPGQNFQLGQDKQQQIPNSQYQQAQPSMGNQFSNQQIFNNYQQQLFAQQQNQAMAGNPMFYQGNNANGAGAINQFMNYPQQQQQQQALVVQPNILMGMNQLPQQPFAQFATSAQPSSMLPQVMQQTGATSQQQQQKQQQQAHQNAHGKGKKGRGQNKGNHQTNTQATQSSAPSQQSSQSQQQQTMQQQPQPPPMPKPPSVNQVQASAPQLQQRFVGQQAVPQQQIQAFPNQMGGNPIMSASNVLNPQLAAAQGVIMSNSNAQGGIQNQFNMISQNMPTVNPLGQAIPLNPSLSSNQGGNNRTFSPKMPQMMNNQANTGAPGSQGMMLSNDKQHWVNNQGNLQLNMQQQNPLAVLLNKTAGQQVPTLATQQNPQSQNIMPYKRVVIQQGIKQDSQDKDIQLINDNQNVPRMQNIDALENSNNLQSLFSQNPQALGMAAVMQNNNVQFNPMQQMQQQQNQVTMMSNMMPSLTQQQQQQHQQQPGLYMFQQPTFNNQGAPGTQMDPQQLMMMMQMKFLMQNQGNQMLGNSMSGPVAAAALQGGGQQMFGNQFTSQQQNQPFNTNYPGMNLGGIQSSGGAYQGKQTHTTNGQNDGGNSNAQGGHHSHGSKRGGGGHHQHSGGNHNMGLPASQGASQELGKTHSAPSHANVRGGGGGTTHHSYQRGGSQAGANNSSQGNQHSVSHSGASGYSSSQSQSRTGGGNQKRNEYNNSQYQASNSSPGYSQGANYDDMGGGRGQNALSRESSSQMGAQSQPVQVPKSPFLEDLRAKIQNGKKIDIKDIKDHVVECSMDQYGSRFIQQKYDVTTPEEKDLIFAEILPEANMLMNDVFGNYVVQKLFEYGTDLQRATLAEQLLGNVLKLTKSMYGCRVVQKALEVISLDQQKLLVQELKDAVLDCIYDQNGNHVIQKCIEKMPADAVDFIVSAITEQTKFVSELCIHTYGCRVIQRILENCQDYQTKPILDAIIADIQSLTNDQFGNYVIQHILEKGKNTEDKNSIVKSIKGKVIELSNHKFASNVVEKCLAHGSDSDRREIIDEILKSNNYDVSEEVNNLGGSGQQLNGALYTMMKDRYGNYVIQKCIEVGQGKQRDILVKKITACANVLKKQANYSRHVYNFIEKMSTEGGGGAMLGPASNFQQQEQFPAIGGGAVSSSSQSQANYQQVHGSHGAQNFVQYDQPSNQANSGAGASSGHQQPHYVQKNKQGGGHHHGGGHNGGGSGHNQHNANNNNNTHHHHGHGNNSGANYKKRM